MTSIAFADLQCPSPIKVKEIPQAPSGWRSEHGEKTTTLIGVEIVQKKGGVEYDLAPDSEKNDGGHIREEWLLTSYRDAPLFLRCRYKTSAATLWIEIPANLKSCSLPYQGDAHGIPVDVPSFSCR